MAKNWLKQNWIKIGVGLLVLMASVLLYLPKTDTEVSNTSIESLTGNIKSSDTEEPKTPLEIADCDYEASVRFWELVGDNPQNLGIRRDIHASNEGNFYIICSPTGSSGVIGVYLFRNNKLFFERSSIYHGDAFMGKDHHFYVVEGEVGEANCCPRSFFVEKYGYDSEKDALVLIATKEYLNTEIEGKDGSMLYYNKELYEFKKEMTADLLIRYKDTGFNKFFGE